MHGKLIIVGKYAFWASKFEINEKYGSNILIFSTKWIGNLGNLKKRL